MSLRLLYFFAGFGGGSILFFLDHKLAAFLWIGGHALSYQIHLIEAKLDRLLDAQAKSVTRPDLDR